MASIYLCSFQRKLCTWSHESNWLFNWFFWSIFFQNLWEIGNICFHRDKSRMIDSWQLLSGQGDGPHRLESVADFPFLIFPSFKVENLFFPWFHPERLWLVNCTSEAELLLSHNSGAGLEKKTCCKTQRCVVINPIILYRNKLMQTSRFIKTKPPPPNSIIKSLLRLPKLLPKLINSQVKVQQELSPKLGDTIAMNQQKVQRHCLLFWFVFLPLSLTTSE